jgi:hypothetical protein
MFRGRQEMKLLEAQHEQLATELRGSRSAARAVTRALSTGSLDLVQRDHGLAGHLA